MYVCLYLCRYVSIKYYLLLQTQGTAQEIPFGLIIACSKGVILGSEVIKKARDVNKAIANSEITPVSLSARPLIAVTDTRLGGCCPSSSSWCCSC